LPTGPRGKAANRGGANFRSSKRFLIPCEKKLPTGSRLKGGTREKHAERANAYSEGKRGREIWKKDSSFVKKNASCRKAVAEGRENACLTDDEVFNP